MLKNVLLAALSVFLVHMAAGSLYAKDIDFAYKVSLGQRYDDNISYAATGKKSDAITRLTGGVRFRYERKRTLAEIEASLTHEMFGRYSKNDNTAESLSFSMRRDLSKFDSVTVTDHFSHAYEPRSFEEEFTRTRGRYSYFRNRFDIAYLKELTGHFSAKAGYGFDLDTASSSDVADSSAHRAMLEGIYAFSSKRMLLTRYEFLHRTLEPGGSAVINTLSAGLRQYLTETMSIEAFLGTDMIDSYNGRTYIKPLLTLSLSDQLTDRLEATFFSFTQRYSTNPYTSDIFDSWRISSGVTGQLYKKLSASANVFYGRGEYVSAKDREDLLGGSIGLTYELNKDWRLTPSYSYSQSRSNVESWEYEKNVISVNVSTEF